MINPDKLTCLAFQYGWSVSEFLKCSSTEEAHEKAESFLQDFLSTPEILEMKRKELLALREREAPLEKYLEEVKDASCLWELGPWGSFRDPQIKKSWYLNRYNYDINYLHGQVFGNNCGNKSLPALQRKLARAFQIYKEGRINRKTVIRLIMCLILVLENYSRVEPHEPSEFESDQKFFTGSGYKEKLVHFVARKLSNFMEPKCVPV